MIIQVTAGTFRRHVLESEVPVVVDFYADWCRPCKQLAPVLDALSEQHEGLVAFTKVNIDEEPELAGAYRISSVPAVLRFDDGAPTAWSLGAKPAHRLEKELKLHRVSKQSSAGPDAASTDSGLWGKVKARWRS